MKTSTYEGNHGMQWITRNQLENLNFADDLAFLFHTHEQMQMKIINLAAASVSVGLNIHEGKCKIIKYNTNSVTLDGDALESVETFTYLGSAIDEFGGSGRHVNAKIGKARAYSYN
ncbi:unnamed protein product [Schistosoma margrebowiei]|uniref:Uncharacterized protein n=1 Tax=Schistosoma margrebowiei TaxID=48269 RepID=A0A183LIC4_9TREM|nr:unnamed protein product [Schistosoma margrebowiei]